MPVRRSPPERVAVPRATTTPLRDSDALAVPLAVNVASVVSVRVLQVWRFLPFTVRTVQVTRRITPSLPMLTDFSSIAKFWVAVGLT